MASNAPRSELAPVEAEFDDEQRAKGESDHADRGERIAEMAPVTRPEVEHTSGDEGEGNGVGAGHPLAVLRDLAIASGDEGSDGAYHPCDGLHGSSGKTWTSGCKSDPCERANKHGDDIDATEDAV